MPEGQTQLKRRYSGVNTCNIDSQRRLLMPKAWRTPTGNIDLDTFWIIPAGNHIIKLCDQVFFNSYSDYLDSLNDSDPKVRREKLRFGSLICQVELDSQGRFALSPEIIEYGQLTQKKIALIGSVSYGRIMNYDDYMKELSDDSASDELNELDERVNDAKQQQLLNKH